MKSHSFFIVVTLSAAYPAITNAADTDFGPLLLRSQAPFQSNGVTTRLRDASPADDRELYISASMASIWAKTDRYTQDYYQNDLWGGMQFAVNSSLKAEFSYLYSYAGNNHLDSITMDYHNLIGISLNGRDEVAKHRFYINNSTNELTDFEGEVLVRAWEVYIEQALSGDKTLSNNSKHMFSVGVTLYFNEVETGPFKDSSFEQAVQLNYTGKFAERHHIYSMLGITRREPGDFQSIPLKESTLNWGVGYQYRASQYHAFLIEYRILEGETKETAGLAPLDQHSHEMTAGYRLHIDHSALEFALVENIVTLDNSVDVAFTVSFRHRF